MQNPLPRGGPAQARTRWPVGVVLAAFAAGLVLAGPAPSAAICVGDCGDDGRVTINELVRSVNIALELAPISQCLAIDANGDGRASINELIQAVNRALFGCPVTATPTPTPTPTPPLGNQAPQVNAGADVLIPLDGMATLTGSASDDGMPDPPGALTLQWSHIDGPGSVTFGAPSAATTSATASAMGSYRLRLTASDGAVSGSDDVMLHVDLAAANQAPALAPIGDQTIAAGTALRLGLSASDPNPFDALSFSLVAGPPGATVDAQGVFGFAPLADQLGTHPVTVRVADPSDLGAERSFTVVVVEGNRPPLLGALPDAVTPAGVPFARALTASDPDGDALTFALRSGPEGLTLAGAQLAWTPTAAQLGTFVVAVEVRDAHGATAVGEFRLIVPAPAAPAARDDTYEVILGQTLTVPAAGVLANDTSIDGSPLSAEQLTPPDKGSVSAFGADGGFTYVAPPALPPPPPLDATVKYQLHYGNTVLSGGYPPLVADVDGDGAAEILFWRGDTLTVVRGSTGEELFSTGGLPEPYSACATYGRGVDSFAAADIDDDGAVEIVMSAQCAADNFNYIYVAGNATRLVALAYDAEAPQKFVVKWLSDPLAPQEPITPEQGGDGHLHVPFGGQAAYTAVTIARLRPAEVPTVLLGKTYSSHAGPTSFCGLTIPGKTDPHCRIVFALDGATGAKKSPYYAAPEDPASVGAYNASSFSAPAAAVVADVDDDGELDILYQGTLWNVDGTIKRQFDGTASTASGTADALLLDLDGDAEMEIVAFDSGNHRRDGILRAWKADGRLLWKLITPGGTVVTRLGAADIDRSGRPTILFAFFTTLFAIDHQGQFKWVRTFPSDARGFHSLVSNGGTVFPVYDLNGDGIVEIVVQYNKSTIEFLRGDTGATQTSWTYPGGANEGSSSVQAPVIADLDGTGEASLIWYHDVNLNNHSFLQVLKGDSAPWRAAPTHMNQRAFWGTNFNPDGSLPATYPRHTADARTNVYLQQPPLPYPLEPRLRTQAQFTYAAQDGALASPPATVTIDILPENRPPVVTALPPEALANANFWEQPYTFQLAGVDPDPGDVITFAPAEEQHCGFDGRATISPEGLFTLTGRPFDEGQCIFRVTLSDGHGGETAAPIVIFFTRQTRVVPDVVGQNRSTALNAILSRDLTLAPQVEVPALAPAGEVLAQHPPAESEVLRGSRVQLTISLGPGPLDTDADGDGFTPNQGDCDDADPAFSPDLPEIPDNGIDENCDGSERIVREVRIMPARALRVTGEQVAFAATAVYVDGTSAAVTPNWASSAPNIASIDGAGLVRALNVGSTAIRAVFGGAVGHATFAVAARNAGDQGEPTAIITAPADGSSVTGPTQITGTAADANFLRYELAIAPTWETTFTTIAEGTIAVVDGVLGVLDSTLLVNQAHTLRLTVWDANGNSESTEVAVLIEGARQVGTFTLTYEDLTLPVSGIPVQVVRTYDSRDKRQGDFGIGWSLDVQTFRASATRVLGSAWRVIKPGLGFVLVAEGSHIVSITLPNGKVESFEMRVTPESSLFVPFSSVRASFTPRPGTLGALESLDNNELLIADAQPGLVTLLDDTTLNDYHPDRFRYTAPDGTQYVVTRTRGGESVRDPSANQITIGPGGIVHSAGPSIVFTRDAANRITGITDPRGQTQTYEYSTAGDLVAHADAAGHTTRYLYDRDHGVVRIIDPLGRPVARADYDDDGRLVALTDAAGHTTTYEHDLASRQELVRDALGRATLMDYDEQGNVLAITDPLGARTTFTYDERGNERTATDPLGGTTTYTYDDQDHVLSVADPLGRTTTFTRDDAGRPLTVTNARGLRAVQRYDAQGNLVESENPLGEVSTLTYDGAGNLASLRDATGTVSNTYDGAGRRTQMIDAMGAVTAMQYDGNGNLLGQQQNKPGADWSLTYDAANRVVGRDFEGLARPLAYDAAGQITQATTATGQPIGLGYDPVGRLASIEIPGGAPLLRQTYDAVGNRTAVTDVLGNEIRYTYDAADRLIATHHPDGSREQRAYDAGGRLVRLTDARGHVTTYEYDAAGQLTARTDAVGGTTRYAYDANGNKTAETDANDHTTTFAYDGLDRLIRTTFADGTTELLAYDDTGRLAQITDTGGHTTIYAYDAAANMRETGDALGRVTRHEHQGGGLRTATVDANGNATRFAYDAAGRLTEITYPLGDTTTVTYDGAGNVMSRTNGAGETVQYQYDQRGWLIGASLPGGATESYTYTADQRIDTVTDARGVTRFEYEAPTRRLARVIEPDGAYVRYAYDAAGNRTLVAHATATSSELITRYAYDAVNRVIQITDPHGGVTTQGYDAVGNLTSIARPNGVTTQIAYDARRRMISLTDRAAGGAILAGETYTLDALGHRTSADRHDGSRLEYEYDVLGRVTRERHLDSGAVVTFESVYAYDAAGNLVASGPPGTPVTYAYNANNQLLSGGGVTFTYDGAGRRVREAWTPPGGPLQSVEYTWDARDRLASYRDAAGATTTYAYDSRGTRVAKDGADGPLDFLVDRENATGYSQIVRQDGLVERNFVYGTRLLQAVDGGVRQFPLFNNIGSARALTGPAGEVTDAFDYQAYGELLTQTGTSALPHRFAGEESDPESGLTYLRARYHDPRTGAFLTRDPLAGNEGDPLSQHRYLYAAGNPVNRTDPSGRQSLPEVLVSSYQRLQAAGQHVLRARRGLAKAKDVTAITMRTLGGVLAVDAIIETMSNRSRVQRWFGGGVLGSAYDLAELGGALTGAVEVIATVGLGRTAIDMLNGRTIVFTIQGFGTISSSEPGQLMQAGKNESYSALCSNATTARAFAVSPVVQGQAWGIHLCASFFTQTPMPTAENLTAQGRSSMPGLMVHEFTHISLRTGDRAYQCSFSYRDDANRSRLGVGATAIVPGLNLTIADSYRCWVEDAAVGGAGNPNTPGPFGP